MARKKKRLSKPKRRSVQKRGEDLKEEVPSSQPPKRERQPKPSRTKTRSEVEVSKVLDGDKARLNRWYVWLAAFLITFSFSVVVRWHDVYRWSHEFKRAFLVEERLPVLTGYDSFYYARDARDLVQGRSPLLNYWRLKTVAGKYAYWEDGWDTHLRARRMPKFRAPLLARLGTFATKLAPSSLPFEWVIALIPIFVGSLIVVPFLLWGSLLGGVFTGIGAALLGTVVMEYFHRTKIGWFDTDILNFTFTLLAAYLAARAFWSKRWNQSVLWGLATGCLMFLFGVWWRTGSFFLIPFVAVGVFSVLMVDTKKWKTALVAFLVIYLSYSAFLFGFLKHSYPRWSFDRTLKATVNRPYGVMMHKSKIYLLRVKRLVAEVESGISSTAYAASRNSYISHEGLPSSKRMVFPQIGRSISELIGVSLAKVGLLSWGTGLVFWLCVAGTLIMGFMEWRKGYVFLLLPILGVGLSCFRSGPRLIPFLTLVVSLGGGYLCHLFYLWVTRRFSSKERITGLRMVFPLLLACFLAGYPAKLNWEILSVPVAPAAVASSFQRLKGMAPLDSVVWTWWDYGYFVQYWGDLGTLADGGSRRNKSSYFLGLAMASSDSEFAARLMNFYATWGYGYTVSMLKPFVRNEGDVVELVKEAMKKGPDGMEELRREYGLSGDWRNFFFPENPVHVYLAYLSDMVPKAKWWYYFGTWDPDRKTGIRPDIYATLCSPIGGGVYQCNGSVLEFNENSGMAVIKSRDVALSEVAVVRDNQVRARKFNDHPSKLVAVLQKLNAQKYRLSIVSRDLYSSIFSKMFLVNIFYKKAFKPAILWNPYVQIWKVKNPDQT